MGTFDNSQPLNRTAIEPPLRMASVVRRARSRRKQLTLLVVASGAALLVSSQLDPARLDLPARAVTQEPLERLSKTQPAPAGVEAPNRAKSLRRMASDESPTIMSAHDAAAFVDTEGASGDGTRLALLGTTLAGNRRVAFLRDRHTGASYMLSEGDQLEGFRIVTIAADHIVLHLRAMDQALHLSEQDEFREGGRDASLIADAPMTGDHAARVSAYNGSRGQGAPEADIAALLEQGESIRNPD